MPSSKLGIHTHDDTENAVANSLAAMRAGARQVQGTLNGLGERCGNANLVSLIPTLALKMGFDVGLRPEALARLTHLSRAFDEELNRPPNRHAAYVGASAFAHKAGLHASAVAKDPTLLRAHRPGAGRQRARHARLRPGGPLQPAAPLQPRWGWRSSRRPSRWPRSWPPSSSARPTAIPMTAASASFALLVRRTLGDLPDYFRLLSFRVIIEHRFNASGEQVTISEATIKGDVRRPRVLQGGRGQRPGERARPRAARCAEAVYAGLEGMSLLDYKVRILPGGGTAAVTRVIIESGDETGRVWQTVGVSGNIIDASYDALNDAITYKLMVDRASLPA